MKGSPKQNIRVLVVDDNQAIHEVMRMLLESFDAITPETSRINQLKSDLFEEKSAKSEAGGLSFEMDSAYQGIDAHQRVIKAEQEGRSYTLIFMDMRMPPGWDGLETSKRIRGVKSDAEIIICTGFSDYSWKTLVTELGSEEHLSLLEKPFKIEDVQQLILKKLNT